MITKNQDPGLDILDTGYRVTYEQLNTLIAFLDIWRRLAMWIRSLVTSIVYDLDNKDATVNELFRIPSELYDTLRIFYGPTIAQQILNLLTNFITSVWRLVEAMKTGDQENVDASTQQLYQTADELAAFLAPINIYWDEQQWRSLLNQTIRLLIDEVVFALSKNHEQEIIAFNRMQEIASLMGSYMARGIIARSMGTEE